MARFAFVVVALSMLSCIGSAQNAPAYDGNYHDVWYPIGTTNTPFATTEGRLFKINGKVQYFTSANAWWVPRLRDNSDIDLIMHQFVESGLKVMRCWGYATVALNKNIPPPQTSIYGSWFQLLNESGTYVNYGANGLRQLDYVVHAAEKNNIFLVLPLVNWNPQIGGINLYHQALGCNQTQWYTDATCQNAYRSYARTIINRYKSSPAVFAWEIMNEPRCYLVYTDTQQIPCNSSVITNWAAEFSAWVKSIDPNHMVTLGEEGWFYPKDGFGDASYAYQGITGADFVDNIKIPTLDYDTVHVYPLQYNYTKANGFGPQWGSLYIKQHDEIGAQVNKPVVVEEYGQDAAYTGVAGWQQTIVKDTKIAMDSIWDFSAHTMETGRCKKGGCPTPVYQDNLSLFFGTAKYQTYIIDHAKAMANKKVS